MKYRFWRKAVGDKAEQEDFGVNVGALESISPMREQERGRSDSTHTGALKGENGNRCEKVNIIDNNQ